MYEDVEWSKVWDEPTGTKLADGSTAPDIAEEAMKAQKECRYKLMRRIQDTTHAYVKHLGDQDRKQDFFCAMAGVVKHGRGLFPDDSDENDGVATRDKSEDFRAMLPIFAAFATTKDHPEERNNTIEYNQKNNLSNLNRHKISDRFQWLKGKVLPDVMSCSRTATIMLCWDNYLCIKKGSGTYSWHTKGSTSTKPKYTDKKTLKKTGGYSEDAVQTWYKLFLREQKERSHYRSLSEEEQVERPDCFSFGDGSDDEDNDGLSSSEEGNNDGIKAAIDFGDDVTDYAEM